MRLELAGLYLECHQDEDAEREYRALLQRFPHLRKATIGLGRVYLERHDYDQAIQQFKSVLSKWHNDVDAGRRG